VEEIAGQFASLLASAGRSVVDNTVVSATLKSAGIGTLLPVFANIPDAEKVLMGS